jgi:hypothetical protein
MKMLMSVVGTKQTCRRLARVSASESNADIVKLSTPSMLISRWHSVDMVGRDDTNRNDIFCGNDDSIGSQSPSRD